MAQGDVIIFDQFTSDLGQAIHDLDSASIYVGLTIGTTTPATTTADPRWGAGGTTDFSAEESTAGGNYSTGGLSASYASTWQTGASNTFDLSDLSWAQNASNPNDAEYGIIYNNTVSGKQAVGSVDLGGTFDMSTGDLSITWNGSGVFTLT